MKPILGISTIQERKLLNRLAESGWIVRLKRSVYLIPPRLPAGGKYSPGIALILGKFMQEVGGKYQICGPSAFNFYGFDGQVPTVTYVYNNKISGARNIGSMAFQFIKVVDRRLGATERFKTTDGIPVIYSSKSRSLMDSVYDWSRFNSLPRGYQWIEQEIQAEPDLAWQLAKVSMKYGNIATMRRIGYLLENLSYPAEVIEKLQRKASRSKSLIPWIPGISERGRVDRKWGLIING